MTTSRNGSARRKRGTLRTLPSGSIQVVVYAGTDPLSGKRHYLEEVVPVGPEADAKAGKSSGATPASLGAH